ncbi:MAG: tryptophan synthase subunit alpha, partial [Bacteroidales bacterium]|nr:tryptophan synthase subunit alpha [Bacteroidales bacterium]
MNRIDKLFDKEKNGVLSVYFTAGFPNLNDTVPVIESLEKNGVKLIEIGIPFSDPMADGPVIQTSGSKALENGMSLRILFNQLSTVRESVQIPLVLMGYLNPIMQFGFDNFCAEAKRCGIDGVIIPDLPFEDYLVNYKSIAEA